MSDRRSGNPGAVQLKTLKPGDVFQYDTIDGVARYPHHKVSKAINARGDVEVKPFCDPAMTGWNDGNCWVFLKSRAGPSVPRGVPPVSQASEQWHRVKGGAPGEQWGKLTPEEVEQLRQRATQQHPLACREAAMADSIVRLQDTGAPRGERNYWAVEVNGHEVFGMFGPMKKPPLACVRLVEKLRTALGVIETSAEPSGKSNGGQR